MHREQKARILKTGEARLTTHMGWWEYTPVLRDLRPFKTGGALHGTAGTGGMGRLPLEYRREYEAREEAIDYTVYSYATPIAWHYADTDQWFVPEVRYSLTTTSHQRLITTAIGQRYEGWNWPRDDQMARTEPPRPSLPPLGQQITVARRTDQLLAETEELLASGWRVLGTPRSAHP